MKAKILPYEELIKIYRNQLKPCPYVVSKTVGTQSIAFIAIKHTNDPQDPQMPLIEKTWREFRENTKTQKAIILSEGGVSPSEKDKSIAIEKYGEPGLLRFWADVTGIEINSPEPSREYEMNELLKKFSHAEIMHYFFVRQIPQWHRTKHESSGGFDRYIRLVLDNYGKVLGWDFDFSLENLIKIHENITGKEFSLEDDQFFFNLSDPTKDSYTTQRVARASSNIRDQQFAARIIEYWEEGYSIFGVFGSAHVFRLEPLIRDL